jgi:pimeloyl-ACP methyl ester carboxylesterase
MVRISFVPPTVTMRPVRTEGRAPARPHNCLPRVRGIAGAPPVRGVAWILLISVLATATSAASSLEFAGVPISPGSTVRAEVPLTAAERSYAADATTNVPDKGVAVVAIPRGFDPAKVWPILVVFSTTDFRRLNRDDLVDFYRRAALTEGWVLIAGDGREFPPHDTNGWRAAMTLAALDALHRSFPESSRWPVSVAGFSGGAKRASLLAPLLVLDGTHVCGMYLTGLNEDVLSVAYGKSHLGKAFLKTPVFISSGTNDPIAPMDRARSVANSIKKAGFQSVRFETFAGGHVVKNAHTIEALRWFRQSCSRGE